MTRISAEWWPLFDLRIRTPRLELRLPTDDDLEEVVSLVAGGIHAPDEMPFSFPWTQHDPPELQRFALQYHWRVRAETTPEHWALPFAVFEDGRMIGQQDVEADGFGLVAWSRPARGSAARSRVEAPDGDAGCGAAPRVRGTGGRSGRDRGVRRQPRVARRHPLPRLRAQRRVGLRSPGQGRSACCASC